MKRSTTGLVVLAVSVMVTALISAATQSYAPRGEESIRLALVWTGRLGFFVFLFPLTVGPLRKLLRNSFTRRLVKARRNVGIAYGGVQVVHIFLIANLFRVTSSRPVDLATILVGGLGLLLVMGMVATSFDAVAVQIGGKNWKRLHRSGLFVCAFIYLYDFVLGPLESGEFMRYLPLAVLILAALGLRGLALIYSKRSAATNLQLE